MSSVEESSTRMISSTHALRDARRRSPRASWRRCARASRRSPWRRPCRRGVVGQRLVGLEHWTRQRILPPPMPTSHPPEIFKAYDVRGLYGEQIDGDVAEGVGRAFARVLGGPRRQAGGRAARRPRARHAADRAGARGALPRRAGGRGRARARRRDGRDGDALLPRRLARPRRRADVHRLAQPEGLHGREAGRARRGGAVAATAGIGDIARAARGGPAARRPAAGRPRRSTSTPSSRTRR